MGTSKEFSVIYLTKRYGGIDLLGHSLSIQYPSFELIVVDAIQERMDRGDAAEFLMNLGIPLRCWIPSKGANLARAMNLGALCSTTPNLIFLQDYSWCPPGWAINWLYSFKSYFANSLIWGTSSVHSADRSDTTDDISLWKDKKESCWKHIREEINLHIPMEYDISHFYIPLHLFEKSSGLDENPSFSCEDLGMSVLGKANLLGYQRVLDKKLRIGRYKPIFPIVELETKNKDFNFNTLRRIQF